MTAAYPAGGFFGFYIQTPGTGAANIDLSTHTASDAVFVRQPTGNVTTTVGSYVEVTGTVTEFAGADYFLTGKLEPRTEASRDGVWVPLESRPHFDRWTDDYASTLPVLLWGHLIGNKE